MDTQLDSRVMELLCARLCHDLVGPVAAVNNGVELVRDFSDEMQDDALNLIGESAAKASRLLQFYRVAFGSAQSAEGGAIGIEEARRRSLDALTSQRIAILWPEYREARGVEVPRMSVKLILNLVLLAVDILPGTGEVGVEIKDGSPTRVQISAKNNDLCLSHEVMAALKGQASVNELTARTVQPFFTGFLAESTCGGIEVVTGTEGITFVIEI